MGAVWGIVGCYVPLPGSGKFLEMLEHSKPTLTSYSQKKAKRFETDPKARGASRHSSKSSGVGFNQ
jgi:hypothetical protein